MNRLLVIGRINPESERHIAEIFAESDASELPSVTGTRHRSLYRLADLFVHLIETEPDAAPPFRAARGHPLFVEVGRRLGEHVSPYLPHLTSPSDAVAGCFYRWDAPVSVPR